MKREDERAPSVYEHASIESALEKKKKSATNPAVFQRRIAIRTARIDADAGTIESEARPWTHNADQALDTAARVDERQAACLHFAGEKFRARPLPRGYPLFLERRRFRDGSSGIIPVTVLSSAVDKGGKSG